MRSKLRTDLSVDNLYFLGLLKLYGITISKDLSGAANAFEKAALLGNPDAQTAIGMMKMKAIGRILDF
jgi:TPR repeat protein